MNRFRRRDLLALAALPLGCLAHITGDGGDARETLFNPGELLRAPPTDDDPAVCFDECRGKAQPDAAGAPGDQYCSVRKFH